MFKKILSILGTTLCFLNTAIAHESIKLNWEIIHAGDMVMGDTYCVEEHANSDWCSDEVPHKVYLDEFMIMRNEVTNQNYEQCVQAGFCDINELHDSRPKDFSGRNQPVVFVSWNQAQAFCKWVGGRLPTEAEWENAAKRKELGGAVFGKKFNVGSPNKVESVHPNSKGLFDMLGNVYEWTQDWYGPYQTTELQINPKGLASGKQKVVKGGSWSSPTHFIRVSDRVARDYELRFSDLGFRCVKSNNKKGNS